MYIDVSRKICGSHDWIIFLGLTKPRNCVFHSSFYDSDSAKMRHAGHANDFLHSPTKVSFPLWCFSLWYMILCAWLVVWTVMEELDVASRYIRALIQFSICLQKILALLGKGSRVSCNKFHVSLRKKFEYASLSKTYVPYVNQTLPSFFKIWMIFIVNA